MGTWATASHRYSFSLVFFVVVVFSFKIYFTKSAFLKKAPTAIFIQGVMFQTIWYLKHAEMGHLYSNYKLPKYVPWRRGKGTIVLLLEQKLKYFGGFGCPKYPTGLLDIDMFKKSCCIYEPCTHIWGVRYASHPFWVHQLLGCHFLQAWQLMSFVQICLDC